MAEFVEATFIKINIVFRIMKKVFLIISGLIVTLSSFAQRPTATLDQVNDMLQNATLYVVMEDSPLSNYNPEIRKAVENGWSLTPLRFIHLSDLDSTKLKNPKNAFLTQVTMKFEEDKDSVKYTFLSLLIGGEYETINDLPEVCTFPLCYDVADEDEMTYKLPAIVAFFNKHVQNIVGNPSLLKDRKFTTYTKQKRSIADKNIYLLKYEQTPSFDEPSEISAVNSIANVTITEDQNALAKIIRRKEANALFLHVVSWTDSEMVQNGEMIPGRCYKILMDVEGNLYYFDFHKMNGSASPELNGMQAKDWKALASYTK